MLDQHIDRHHEEVGAQFLRRYFGCEITEPICLHVAAQRYLCAVDLAYFGKLSPTTKHILALQGDPMPPVEVRAFESTTYAREAMALRRGMMVPLYPGSRPRVTSTTKPYWKADCGREPNVPLGAGESRRRSRRINPNSTPAIPTSRVWNRCARPIIP